MGELYGEVDLDTLDWFDGLASKILRKFTLKHKKKVIIKDLIVNALKIKKRNFLERKS